jgi:tRNA wybutosine-synthesizing protein 2
MPRDRLPPAERVRARLRAAAGVDTARTMPPGYQRLGRVLVLRLPESLRPFYATLGAAWQEELGVDTVLVRSGPIDGEFRRPRTETVAGGETETEVVEHGVRWTFDAARLMFAAGNRTERRRAGRLVRSGEVVLDMFAGIGYFAIPAALSGRPARVVAVEKNPDAVRYLVRNAERNGVADRIVVVEGDNRTVPLPPASADRIFLGYLPSAVPWVPRALELLRSDGGWLHVHTVSDARGAVEWATEEVADSIEAEGAQVAAIDAREVKPYGPGRTHVVVDIRATPRGRIGPGHSGGFPSGEGAGTGI